MFLLFFFCNESLSKFRDKIIIRLDYWTTYFIYNIFIRQHLNKSPYFLAWINHYFIYFRLWYHLYIVSSFDDNTCYIHWNDTGNRINLMFNKACMRIKCPVSLVRLYSSSPGRPFWTPLNSSKQWFSPL
jgi:hypothetical protein